MKENFRSKYLAALIIVIVLISTNPSKEDFANWAVQIDSKTHPNSKEVAKKALLLPFAKLIIDSGTDRKNFLICSVYKNTVSNKIEAIGILGNFIMIPENN